MKPQGPSGTDEVGEHLGEIPSAASVEMQVLRDEVSRLQMILDSALDYAIITMDLQGRITDWNAGAEQVAGYKRAEAVGKSGAILLTAEDWQHGLFPFEMSRALASGRASGERWHLRRDGTRFWASGVLMPLLSAKSTKLGFLYILRDRTNTRPTAERLQLLSEVPIGQTNSRAGG